MNVTDISTTASLGFGNDVNAISGASTYVPTPATTTDSTSTLINQLRSDIKKNSQDFKDLKTALNSNDASAATRAFNAVQQDIQKASQSADGKSLFSADSSIGKDFQAIGDALKSGDLTGAKQAFATFRHDIKRAGHASRAHRHQPDNDGDADDGVQSASPSSTNGKTTSALDTILDAQA
jgi:hypothetical protein